MSGMKLPEDVVLEILSRLPAKSLIRFKAVCKLWYDIIDDPTFISRHYQNISFKQGRRPLLISRRDNATNERVISLLECDGDGSDNTILVDQDLPMSLKDIFGHVRLIGPCNGIVCLYGYTDDIGLWNPSIHDFKMLPRSQVPHPPNSRIRGGDLGIGFDLSTHDVKVIQILFCIASDGRLTYQVEIYSSRTNTWKEYKDIFPANIMYYNLWSMVYKNETFCWWAQDDDGVEIILSFNMRKEAFTKTKLPSNIQGLEGQHRTTRAILPLKESIALLVYNQKGLDKVFDIWVLNELGEDSEGWNKLASVGPISSVERPLGFWNDEDLILESNNGELVVYKIRNNEIRKFGIYGKRNRLEVVVYKESLFSITRVINKRT